MGTVLCALAAAPVHAQCDCDGGAPGITSLCDLDDLSLLRGDPAAEYRLCNDIHVGAWAPIEGVFVGTLDGRGHALIDVDIDAPGMIGAGFFRELGAGAVVRSTTFARPSVVGHRAVGTVAGTLRGRIEDVFVTDGLVLGGSYSVGGLVGDVVGGIVTDASFIDSSVSGFQGTGGIAGFCGDGNISRVASSGSVTDGYQVGGIVGTASGCGVNYATTSALVYGDHDVGGIVGLAQYSLIARTAVYGTVNVVDSTGSGIVNWAYETWIEDSVMYGALDGLWSGIVRGGLTNTVEVNRDLAICTSACAITAGAALEAAPGTSFFLKRTGDPTAPIYADRARSAAQLAALSTYQGAGWSIAASGTSTVWLLPSGQAYPHLSFDRVCGNGTVTAYEECDDGNLTSGDGCSSACKTEYCGNQIVDFGEDCDDGNATAGDGCDAACRVDGYAQWRPLAGAPAATNIAWNYTMGYHFTPSSPSFATEVGGRWNGTKPVRLYDRTSGALLAQASVASANAFAYGSLASPIPLAANRGYTVAVVLGGNGGSYEVLSSPLPRTAHDVRIDGSAYVWGDGRPTNSVTSYMYGQADVEVRPAALERPWQQAENGDAPTTATYTNWLYGYEWSAAEDGAVFALGGKVQGPFTALMYDVATGQELARVDVNGASTSAYTYGRLAVPVRTVASQHYVVAIWLSGDELDVIRMNNAPLPLAAGSVVIEKMVYDWQQRAPRGTLFHMLGQADMEWAPLPH